MNNINATTAQKVLDTVDAGLVSGLGNAKPGEMCVEAAVCFALGEPHNDRPTCVGEAVRAYKISLNDSNWSSPTARAKGMRRVAVAQLGSVNIDQADFAKRVALRNVNTLLADAFEAIGLYATALRSASDLGAAESAAESAARSAAESAARSAESAAWSAESAAWSAAWSAARSAESAAWSAAWSAARSAWSAARSAESAARSAESAARSAAWSAARSAAWSAARSAADAILSQAAEMVVQVLIEMECPGTKFLFLTETPGG